MSLSLEERIARLFGPPQGSGAQAESARNTDTLAGFLAQLRAESRAKALAHARGEHPYRSGVPTEPVPDIPLIVSAPE